MAYKGHNQNLFQWKFGNKSSAEKRVESVSEFAVSELFSHKKPHLGSSALARPLQSSAQLKDHDDAYSEAQALLGDWLHSKLRLALEMNEEDDPILPSGKSSPVALDNCVPSSPNYTNFDDLYSCLTAEEESSTIKNILEDMMDQEVLDSAMMDQLAMDTGQTRKKFRNPAITMEARHKLVRENKARREAERQRQQREREIQQRAREEDRRREKEMEQKRKHQARVQEDMIQQEMVRLRRQMEEQRCTQQLAQQRKREFAKSSVAKNPQCGPLIPTAQQKMDQRHLFVEQHIQTLLYMHNMKCLQRHFTGWFSLVLNQRIQMDKAKTVCRWRRKLKVWRVWRAQVLLRQHQHEVERTKEELRAENRRFLLAVQSDKRRLLRHFLNKWQVWTEMEREQRKISSQQKETRLKMAALISAATTGKLWATQNLSCQPVTAPTETAIQTQTEHKEPRQSTPTVVSDTSLVLHDINPGANMAPVTLPTEPWQISRQHVAPNGAEIQRTLQRDRGSSCLTTPGARFEHRHTTQQQIISQQRKLLKEQQDQILQLKMVQHVMGFQREEQNTAQLLLLPSPSDARPRVHESGAPQVRGPPDGLCGPRKKTVTRQTCPHPIITAMEARAHQRAERRKQVEEIKKRKEEEKLAELKAAEEQRQQEEQEEKHRAAERRKEERRKEREREEEKQRQLRRLQELMSLARQHYHQTLLRQHGFAPWKGLVQLTRDNMQLAQSHHNLSLLRRCTLSWQHATRESLSKKEASADQLHQHSLLRRSLGNWKKLMDWQIIQEERAIRFHRLHTLRSVLKTLHIFVAQEKLLEWEHNKAAERHNSRRVLQRWFQAWRQLPVLLRREREKERRREKLVRKVVDVLPDFCPPSNFNQVDPV